MNWDNSYNPAKAILIIMLLGISLQLSAQDTLQIVMGTVRNSSNYEPISFAIVKNEMRRTKIISNEQGQFIIPFNRGDLLKITAIGFDDGFYIVNDSSELITDFPVQLKPRIYELKEFTLTPYKTVLQFKHAVAQLELPESNLSLELNLPQIKRHLPSGDEEYPATISFMSPISFLYNTFSHKGKMNKKYRILMANDYKGKIVQKKFNRNLVASIVPIETNEELDAFIEFCCFDFSFLLNASEYELIAAIQRKYSEYILTNSL
jgi:hypothetical protein